METRELDSFTAGNIVNLLATDVEKFHQVDLSTVEFGSGVLK